jgi:hypothetical protein
LGIVEHKKKQTNEPSKVIKKITLESPSPPMEYIRNPKVSRKRDIICSSEKRRPPPHPLSQ